MENSKFVNESEGASGTADLARNKPTAPRHPLKNTEHQSVKASVFQDPTQPILRVEVPPRRGLSRPEAGLFIGVGTTKFDQLVADGRMPLPLRIDGRAVWDIRSLNAAFDDLSTPTPDNSDDARWKPAP